MGAQVLQELMNNEFGNYVLQTLLRRVEPAARTHALQLVEANVTPSNYGRTILTAAHAAWGVNLSGTSTHEA